MRAHGQLCDAAADVTQSAASARGGRQAPAALYGANRWDAAEFATDNDKEKFEKLMVRRVRAADGHLPDAMVQCSYWVSLLSRDCCCSLRLPSSVTGFINAFATPV